MNRTHIADITTGDGYAPATPIVVIDDITGDKYTVDVYGAGDDYGKACAAVAAWADGMGFDLA